jgi:uroporphyrinogen-III decarboxylase
MGELRKVQRHMPESFTWGFTEHLVKSASDLRPLRYIIESQQYEENRGEVEQRLALYGNQGLPVMSVPRTPLSRMFVEFAGVETTIYALCEEPEEMRKIFDSMEASDNAAYHLTVNAPGPLVMFPDNLTSEVVSPQLFERYSFAYYERRIRELHGAGKWCVTHIDGTLRGLLPVLACTSLDGVEGLTPFPIGDARPDELRALTNEQIVLFGGIPGAMFVPGCREEDFRDYVIQYLTTLRVNPRLVLGVGDQVPPRSDITRVRLVADLVEEFGRY